MRENRWLIPLAFAAIYLIWGSTYLAIRFAIETLPPFLMAGARFLVAGLVVYVWARWRGAERPSAAQWRSGFILGALLLVGGNGLVSWAELTVPSGLAALLVSTVPLFVVLLEWLGPRSIRIGRPRRLVVLGIVAGLAGVAILIGPGELLGTRVDTLGALAVIGASLSWSIGSVSARKLPKPPSPVIGTAMQMLAGGALLLVVGAATGEIPAVDLTAISGTSLLALLYLIVFGSILAFTAYIYLLQHVAVAKVSTYAYVNPVVALMLGWALAGEALTPRTLIASTIILAAVVLITTQRRSPQRRRSDSGELARDEEAPPAEPTGLRTVAATREPCAAADCS